MSRRRRPRSLWLRWSARERTRWHPRWCRRRRRLRLRPRTPESARLERSQAEEGPARVSRGASSVDPASPTAAERGVGEPHVRVRSCSGLHGFPSPGGPVEGGAPRFVGESVVEPAERRELPHYLRRDCECFDRDAGPPKELGRCRRLAAKETRRRHRCRPLSRRRAGGAHRQGSTTDPRAEGLTDWRSPSRRR